MSLPAEGSDTRAAPREHADRVVINGWYGLDNAGDEAILQVFIARFVKQRGRSLTVLSERPDRIDALYGDRDVAARFHFHTVGWAGLKNLVVGRLFGHLRVVGGARLFVLGGGSLLRDNTTWRNLFRILDEIAIARLFRVPVALYAIGVGPFRTRLGKWLIARAVRSCRLITVRDRNSGRLLEGIGIPRDRIHVVGDPAILLEPAPVQPGDDAVLSDIVARARELHGLYLTEELETAWGHARPLEHIARALDRLHAERGMRFAAIALRCHAGFDDRATARKLRGLMTAPEALVCCESPLPPEQIKWLCGRFRSNITVRLHAMIFALSMGAPVVAVNYEPKVRNIIESMALERYLVEIDGTLDDALCEAAGRCLDSRDDYVRTLAEGAGALRANAARCFELMEDILGRPRSR